MTKFVASKENHRIAAWTQQGRQFDGLYRTLQAETGKLVPPRRALTLESARGIAPYFRLLEIKLPQLALVRILGTAIVNRTRIEHTGRNFLDSFSPDVREQSWGHFQRLISVPCGAVLRFEEEYEQSVMIEVVSFPLADSDSEIRFVGSTVAEIDRNDLTLRGERAMQGRSLLAEEFIDIGNGTGAARGEDSPEL